MRQLPISRLSKKDLEVLDLAMAGFQDKEIAADLRLKISTVIARKRRIRSKLHVKSIREALFICIEHLMLKAGYKKCDLSHSLKEAENFTHGKT